MYLISDGQPDSVWHLSTRVTRIHNDQRTSCDLTIKSATTCAIFVAAQHGSMLMCGACLYRVIDQ